MNKFIKHIFLALFLLANTYIVFGQKIDFQNPPKEENTYLFNILKYNRQSPPPKYMSKRFEEILKIPKNEWTGSDSLFYAYENVHLENFNLALSIFARLNVDTIREPHAQTLYNTTLLHLDRFELLKENYNQTISEDKSEVYSIKQALLDLTDAYLKSKHNTFIPDSTLIFPILQNPILDEFNRDKSPNNNKLVGIAFAIDSAFRHYTILHDKKDLVLAQAFEEMGDFQKKYFYVTNAHFYYSASRHYSTIDKVLTEKLNNVVDEMNDKNFIQISFKNKFGKLINNRFRMKTNFKDIAERDSLVKSNFTPPPKRERRKDYLPWIDNSILIIIILALALGFVLFFLKTKKD